jgi:hypothetical protein
MAPPDFHAAAGVVIARRLLVMVALVVSDAHHNRMWPLLKQPLDDV